MTECKNGKFGTGVIHDLKWKGQENHFKPNKGCVVDSWLIFGLLQNSLLSVVIIGEMTWLGFFCGDNLICVINVVKYLYYSVNVCIFNWYAFNVCSLVDCAVCWFVFFIY